MPKLSEREDKSLDYLRALAAILVLGFHVHILFPNMPAVGSWPGFAVIRQGYIGVSLFLVLSGFLFMKLALERGLPKNITHFYANRLIRVGPLFVVIFLLATAINRNDFTPGDILYLLITNIGKPPTSEQFITGTAWSVSLELLFYLIFPLLGKFAKEGGIQYLLKLILISLFLKAAVYTSSSSFQLTMYSTIIGRFDQFLFGMIAAMTSHHKSPIFKKYKIRPLIVLLLLTIGAYSGWLEACSPLGGNNNEYLWLLIPSIEGILFAALIYLSFESCSRLPRAIDSVLTRVALSSYSLYLLHPAALELTKRLGVSLNLNEQWNPGLAVFGIGASFIIADFSYQVIERPFLALKKAEKH